jgi:carbamoylphosphate synthase large subunit
MGTNILRINPAYQVKRTVMFNGTSPIGKPVQLIRESSERGIFYEIMVDGKLKAGATNINDASDLLKKRI